MKIQQFQWTATGGWAPALSASALHGSAQLVLVFGRGSLLRESRCLDEVRTAFRAAHVVGCSTGGEVFDSAVCDDTITATAIRLEHGRIAVASAEVATIADSFAAGRALVQQLEPIGLRHVFALSDGLLVNSSHFVAGMKAALPNGTTATGGFAADSMNLAQTFVCCDGEPRSRAVAAIGFYGERLRIGVGVTGRWGPYGPDRIITRSKDNVLYEFDGKPALALYKLYLGGFAAGLPAAGLMFPLELQLPDGGRVLRALLGVDEQTQSITFAGNMPEGATARFTVGHIEDLIEGTLVAAKTSLRDLGGVDPELSLVVSCNARRMVLKLRVDEEIEAARDVLGPRTAITGFYSYGEIGPSGPQRECELHNETLTCTNLAEV